MSRIASIISQVIHRTADGVGRDAFTTAARAWPGRVRLFVLLAGALVNFAGCQRGEQSGPAASAPPPPKVLVSHPIERPLAETREYTGHLEAVEAVSVRALVHGILQKIHFEEGLEMEQGAGCPPRSPNYPFRLTDY